MFGETPLLTSGTRRMYLPAGGSFDLPLPGGSGSFVENNTARPLGIASEGSYGPIVLTAAAGLLLGAGVTWLILRNR